MLGMHIPMKRAAGVCSFMPIEVEIAEGDHSPAPNRTIGNRAIVCRRWTPPRRLRFPFASGPRVDRISALDIELYLVNPFRKREKESRRKGGERSRIGAALRERRVAQIKIGVAPSSNGSFSPRENIIRRKNCAKYFEQRDGGRSFEDRRDGKNKKQIQSLSFSLSLSSRYSAIYERDVRARSRLYALVRAESRARVPRGNKKGTK